MVARLELVSPGVGLPGAVVPGRLLVAFPLYKLVSAEFFRKWLDADKTFVQRTISINHVYIVDAFRRLVEHALSISPWDRLVFVEQDMLLPRHALTRMAYYSAEQAVVCGTYFKHQPPHAPIAYEDGVDGNFRAVSSAVMQGWLASGPALHEVGGVGFGCTGVARHVLEDWDGGMSLFENDLSIGHDLWFCRQARRQGFKVFVDTGIVCGHLSEVPISADHNLGCLQGGSPGAGIGVDHEVGSDGVLEG